MQRSAVATSLSRLVAGFGESDLTDVELLQRYVTHREEAAFGLLVRRHGPMVLDLCRSLLRCHTDADDAFQAVFLTLATKARSLHTPASLASWLHGVAYRIAMKTRVAAARRRAREARIERRRDEMPADLSWSEVYEAIHESLLSLPERYRAPLVLCYLNSRTQEEAAHSLGLSRAGLRKRLERGRSLLRERLVRKGLGATAALLAAAWPARSAAALPAPLVQSVTHVGLRYLGEGTTGNAAVPPTVLALVEGGSRFLPARAAALVCLLALTLATASFALLRMDSESGNALEVPLPEPSSPATQRLDLPLPVEPQADPLPRQAIARLGTTRFRSDSWINVASVAPGGNQILGLGFKSVILWDAATGREVRRFACPIWRKSGKDGTGYSVQIESYAASPDGKLLAAGTTDGSKEDCPILLFDLATGQKLGEWPGHRSNQFSANSVLTFVSPALLISSGADGTTRVWDTKTRKEVSQLPMPPKSSLWQLVPSPDGKLVFGSGSDEKSGLWTAWEVATGRVVHREANIPGEFVRLAVSADAKRLAVIVGIRDPQTGSGHTEVRLLALPSGKEVRRWRAHEGKAFGRCSVAFAPSGQTIATGGADQCVRRWNVDTGKEVGLALRPYAFANGVCYLDADTLVTFGSQHALKFWDATTGRPKKEFTGAESHLAALAYSPDGEHVATGGGGGDATVRVWHIGSGRQVAHLKSELMDITCLRFSANGKELVSGASGGAAHVWDWSRGGEPVRVFPGRPAWLHALALSPDGKRLATGGEPDLIHV